MPVIDNNLIMQRVKKEKESPVYSTKEVFQIMYNNLPKVMDKGPDKVLDSSKYVRIAKDYRYDNYRLCTYKDIINLELVNSLTIYQKRFISRNGAVIAIFNTLNRKPVSLVFRSVSQKEFMDFSLVYSVYGYDMIDDNFKYGDYLVITEGQYDADSLRRVYPNVVATQTSNITLIQTNILKSMTDKFIIAFDSDNAGIDGFEKAIKRLGTDIKRLPIYGTDKDVGVMEEMKKIPMEYQERFQFYKDAIEDCKVGIGFSL